jgi:hypothetical protein
VLDQLLPRFAQIGALAEPLHERDIQTTFQFLDLMRNRRLRQIQLFGSRGEVAMCDHLNKCPELIEIEAPHDNKYPLLL